MSYCPYKKTCTHSEMVLALSPNNRPCDNCCEGCHYYRQWESEGKPGSVSKPRALTSNQPTVAPSQPNSGVRNIRAPLVNCFVALARTLTAAFR